MWRACLDPTQWPWPGGCQICLAWGTERLCKDCLARFCPAVLRCPRCAQRLFGPHCADCLREPPAWDGAVCAVDYAPPWDRLLHGLKYHEQLGAAPALGHLLACAVRAAQAPTDALCLLPVPLHPHRLAQRGYNQSQRLASVLAGQLGVPLAPGWVLRVEDNLPQAQTESRDARWRQMQRAFALAPKADVRDRHIALVDDVMTTGATMSALATLLRRHGAASVQAWAVARTPRPHD